MGSLREGAIGLRPQAGGLWGMPEKSRAFPVSYRKHML